MRRHFWLQYAPSAATVAPDRQLSTFADRGGETSLRMGILHRKMRKFVAIVIIPDACALAGALLATGIAPAALAVRLAGPERALDRSASPLSPMCGWCFRHLTSGRPLPQPAAASPDVTTAMSGAHHRGVPANGAKTTRAPIADG
jgi:hypothetical protein